MKILVVDDDFFTRMALSLILKICGIDMAMQIEEAENGLIALNKVIASPSAYSIIFMDCNMPVMDGYVSTKKILEHFSTLGDEHTTPTIIGLTGHSGQEFVDKGLEAGMTAMHEKPAQKDKIMKVLVETGMIK